MPSEMSSQIKIVKMNVDENPQTPGQYGIREFQRCFYFKDGKTKWRADRPAEDNIRNFEIAYLVFFGMKEAKGILSKHNKREKMPFAFLFEKKLNMRLNSGIKYIDNDQLAHIDIL